MLKVNKRPFLFIGFALIFCIVLAVGNPYSTSWTLKCPLHYLTGLQCPFCGAQRALHESLHGNIKEAWMLNPGLFLLSPYLFLLLAGQMFPAWQSSHRLVRWAYRDATIFSVITLLLLWGIIRNLL